MVQYLDKGFRQSLGYADQVSVVYTSTMMFTGLLALIARSWL